MSSTLLTILSILGGIIVAFSLIWPLAAFFQGNNAKATLSFQGWLANFVAALLYGSALVVLVYTLSAHV